MLQGAPCQTDQPHPFPTQIEHQGRSDAAAQKNDKAARPQDRAPSLHAQETASNHTEHYPTDHDRATSPRPALASWRWQFPFPSVGPTEDIQHNRAAAIRLRCSGDVCPTPAGAQGNRAFWLHVCVRMCFILESTHIQPVLIPELSAEPAPPPAATVAWFFFLVLVVSACGFCCRTQNINCSTGKHDGLNKFYPSYSHLGHRSLTCCNAVKFCQKQVSELHSLGLSRKHIQLLLSSHVLQTESSCCRSLSGISWIAICGQLMRLCATSLLSRAP